MRVLVVADEPRSARRYVARLRADGHSVDPVRTAAEGAEAPTHTDYDGLVVALASEREALHLLVEARHQNPLLAALVVARRDEAEQRIAALEAGADDYLAQPVNLDELSLRVRKLLVRGSTRRRARLGSQIAEIGRVTLDQGRREVLVDGRRVVLTPIQYALLEQLLTHHDCVVRTRDLIDGCWDWARLSQANPLLPQMSRLRRAFRGVLRIEAVPQVGYRARLDDLAATDGRAER